MGWLMVIIYIIWFIAAIAAWINTKIILEELHEIKKHLGILEVKPTDLQNPSEMPDLKDLENYKK